MRLNANIRSQIHRAAMKKLDEEQTAHDARTSALCAKLHALAWPSEIIKAANKLHSLSVSWLRLNNRFVFNVAGQYVDMTCSPALVSPANSYNGSVQGGRITDKDAVEEVRKWQADDEDLKDRVSRARKTLDAILKSVGSTDSLFKIWPEGQKFYTAPPLVPGPGKYHVPAVQMQALNEMLGLS